MSKVESFQDLTLAPPADGQELWRWLYEQLRTAVLTGRLRAGSRLPSTRSLAAQYKLSRGTVTTAFDQLRAEGYIEAQTGAGTFVASQIPDHPVEPAAAPAPLPQSTAGLSRRGAQSVANVRILPPTHVLGRAFRTYEPAVDQFPAALWARVAGRVIRRAPRSAYGQGQAGGYQPLRKAIAEYVGPARGVRCRPEQIIVTSGAQQALDLAFRLILDPGDPVLVEDPCYSGTANALRAAGASLIPVPVDADGMLIPATPARAAYVTPSNQFPLGRVMSIDRRLALLRWAVSNRAWIIEDEFDAEYRYSGHPIASLQSLDTSGSILYVGTFTKLLFNALRLGFLVVPERLVPAFEAARSIIDRHPPTLDQAILAEFIMEGHFGHHIRRMRQLYAERAQFLYDTAREKLAGTVDVELAATGMRTVGWLNAGSSDQDVLTRATAAGLEVAALSSFTLEHPQPPALILGFAGCTPSELRRGVNILSTIL